MNASIIVRVAKTLLCNVIILMSMMSCASSASDASLTILFTGDVLLDRGVRPVAEHKGLDYIFREVTPIFKEADAVVVNLECPLTDTISPINKQYIFRADARWANDLKRVGITHAAMANNHTNDQGRRGLVATNQHLIDAGIVPFGYGCSYEEQLTPSVIQKDGISVALFNSILLPIENWNRIDGKPGIAQPSENELVSVVSDYKKKHPDTHVVAVLHWGVEFQSSPTIRQRGLAHKLAEAGVDAIIGHHPHVLQPIDTVAGIPVYYSIGNFVFDQHKPQTCKSMIASLTFRSDGKVSADSISIKIEGCCPKPH